MNIDNDKHCLAPDHSIYWVGDRYECVACDEVFVSAAAQRQALRDEVLAVVESEYHKRRTIGRQDENGDTKLYIQCDYRDGLRTAISTIFEGKGEDRN